MPDGIKTFGFDRKPGQAFQIVEKHPNGENSFTDVFNWVEDIKKTVSDTGAVWKTLKPLIKDSLKYEFSGANPNNWPGLSPSYIAWKTEKGFPTTIGVRTGALKESLTESAKVKETKSKLIWGANLSITGWPAQPVSEYGWKFNLKRPIYKYTKKFLNKNIKQKVVDTWLKLWRREGVIK